MKRHHWNYLRTGLLMLLQGILVTILFYPWLQLAADYWHFNPRLGSLWIFLTIVLGIFSAQRNLGLGQKGLVYLFSSLLASSFLASLWRLPLLLSLLLALALLFLAGRFTDYPARRSFTADWGWFSLILVLSSLFQPQLGYELGIGLILLFFGLSTTALILWNTIRGEEKGLRPDYSGLGRSIPLFILSAAALALLLGLALSPEILQKSLNAALLVYHGLVEIIVFFLVRPLAWLAAPLFRWAEGVEMQEFAMEIPESQGYSGDLLPGEQALSPQALQSITWISWLLALLVLVILIWIVFRRVLRKKDKKQGFMVEETRESVFSGAEVLADLKNAFLGVLRPFSRRKRWHRGADPLQKIRGIYARFVLKMGKKADFAEGATPWEYAQKLAQHQEGLNWNALQRLTELYNQARYAEKGDGLAAEEAQKLSQEIKR